MSVQSPATKSSRRAPLALAASLMVLVLLLAFTLNPAAAAQLPLAPGSISSASVADRCTRAVSATAGAVSSGESSTVESSTVELAGLGTACGGRELALTLFGEGGEAVTSGTISLAAGTTGSATVAVPGYKPADVDGAAVTIGTWGVPADWTYTPPAEDPATEPLVSCTVLNDPTGTKTCDVTDVRIDVWGYPQPDNYNFYATVTSPSESEDVEWQLTINMEHPDLKLAANVVDSHNGVTLAPGWSCSAMPMLEVRGQADVNTKYVGGDKTVTVWLQGKASSGPATGGNLFNCS